MFEAKREERDYMCDKREQKWSSPRQRQRRRPPNWVPHREATIPTEETNRLNREKKRRRFIKTSQRRREERKESSFRGQKPSESAVGGSARHLTCRKERKTEKMSKGSPIESTSSVSDSDSPTISQCTICRIEPFSVYYMRVAVCTGCRAFFRRTIKEKKRYKCLNGRLCGQNALVPTRRACKYCRFQKCIEAGMLESKLHLHSEERKRISNFSKRIPAITGSILISAEPDDILGQFTLLRRRARFEFFSSYRDQFGFVRSGGGDSALLADPHPSPDGTHDMKVCHVEFLTFNRLAREQSRIFEDLSDSDWGAFSHIYGSQYYYLFNRVIATTRFGGHQSMRSYNADGTFIIINEDYTKKHHSYIRSAIRVDNPEAAFNIIHNYMFALSVSMVRNVAKRVADVHLDEMENSALLMLLFTDSDCRSDVSATTAAHLCRCRQKTLRSLASHISSTGRDVANRMAEIIFLIEEFQKFRYLANHLVRLMYSATERGVLPDEYRDILSKKENTVTEKKE